jgi:hypothetical protein
MLRHLRMDRHGLKKGRTNISVQIKKGRTKEERKLGDYLNDEVHRPRRCFEVG